MWVARHYQFEQQELVIFTSEIIKNKQDILREKNAIFAYLDIPEEVIKINEQISLKLRSGNSMESKDFYRSFCFL